MTALLIGLALIAVIGVKYYTAVGHRNLERRLMGTRRDLDDARKSLKAARERQSEVNQQEELAVLRLQYMKDKIEDLKIQLATKDEPESIIARKDEKVAPIPAPPMFTRM